MKMRKILKAVQITTMTMDKIWAILLPSPVTLFMHHFGIKTFKTFCACNPDLQAIATVTGYVQTVTAMLMPALCSRLIEIIPPPPPPHQKKKKKKSLGHCNNWHLLLFFSVFLFVFTLKVPGSVTAFDRMGLSNKIVTYDDGIIIQYSYDTKFCP